MNTTVTYEVGSLVMTPEEYNVFQHAYRVAGEQFAKVALGTAVGTALGQALGPAVAKAIPAVAKREHQPMPWRLPRSIYSIVSVAKSSKRPLKTFRWG